MPAPRQQRKAAAGPKVKASQQHTSSSISSFARVSKTVGNAGVKKELAPSTPTKNVKLEAITPASRKRRAIAPIEDDSSADESTNEPITSIKKITSSSTATTPVQPVKRGRGRPPKKARPEPTPKKRVRSPSVSDSEASTIDTGVLFKKLRLESSPSRSSSPATADTSVAGSDNESDTKPTKSGGLPEEVLNLIDLHAAFLKTLTLHYAHNGSNVPADLRILCPNIARAWGKKKVTDADIRICLGILGSCSSSPNSSPFSLSNYGRGKVCIEINQSRNFGPLSEDRLNALFRTNITSLWTKFSASEDGNTPSGATAFLPTLPKAPVTLCESLAKASPLMLKGQQRLEDLKHGIAVKKQEKAGPKPSTTTDTPMKNADGTRMSLLDRIRMKSLQKAAMPAGLSPAQLERRGALQRVEEVSALIGMLSRASSEGGMGGRISFTMSALLEKLKDSFRMGISKQEGAVCVRVLASEVAPEWIRVVTLSGRENVVVEVSCQLGKPEVARRVQDILAKE
ncbi:hypothetical protein F5Y09DRAFT_315786 [Xylaria sp. FL1042]|nr:hypothetical protein F5Y09DRAFT_315786 [Xylaria sp. FL1042]